MDLTQYLANKLLDLTARSIAYSRPATLYLALCTEDPGADADGSSLTEPSGDGYARVSCDSWTTASGRGTATDTAVTFPAATGSWGTITHVAVCDALTGGNVLAVGELDDERTVVSGETPTFRAGDINISINAGDMSNYLANKLLDHVFANSAFAPPATLYVAPATAAVLDSTTGATAPEPDHAYYSRTAVGSWNAATLGAISNGATLNLPGSVAGLGTITTVMVLDAATAGNLLFYGALTAPVAVGAGNALQFATESLEVRI